MKYGKQFLLALLLASTVAISAMQPQADSAKVSQLFAAIRSGNSVQVASLLSGPDHEALANSNFKGIAMLREAATGGNLAVVQELIKAGANIDAADGYNMTPLMLAVLGGHTQVAFALIKAGANVNAKDKSGQSVLQWVQFGGKTTPEQKAELTKFLKEYGAK